MKKYQYFTMLCIVLILQSCTMITTKSAPIDKVVKIDNASKNALYVRANNWMVDVFNNAKSVIQFNDKESGSISGRYLLGTISSGSQYGPARFAYASIKIKVKDGATKITVKPESFTYAKGNMYSLYTEADSKRDVNSLISSFVKSMKKSEDANW